MSGLLIQHARWQGELITPDDTGSFLHYLLKRGNSNTDHLK